ncbi:MAG: hypothetical protein Q9201_001026 [Fulgogasparrea decipioides]
MTETTITLAKRCIWATKPVSYLGDLPNPTVNVGWAVGGGIDIQSCGVTTVHDTDLPQTVATEAELKDREKA